MYFQIFGLVEKDSNHRMKHLERVEELVTDGVGVLEACRRLPKCQQNSFPPARKILTH